MSSRVTSVSASTSASCSNQAQAETSDAGDQSRKSRKRVRREEEWKSSQRKAKRNRGEAYVSKTGKEVDGKVMNDRSCDCALRCFEVVTQAQRQKVFSGFWELGNIDIQNAYLCGCVKVLPVKRHYTPVQSRRGNTRVYYINNGDKTVRVCKIAFLRMHVISSGRLTRTLANQATHGGIPTLDARGHKEPPNKTSHEDMDAIRHHIKSFPNYVSHYSRKDNPNRKYLSPDLSVAKMFQLYKEKMTAEQQHAVSEWVYRKVFNQEFNLSFGRPKTDTCKTCDALHIQLEAETSPEVHQQLQGQLLLHQRRAERTCQQLKEDTALAQSDASIETITFDLQKSLPTPVLTVSIVYYKRQLWTYNLGIHRCGTGIGYMHMWDESVGSRGSQEIGSCLLTFLKETIPSAQHVIAYSDSCGGQNRNINMVCLWLHVVGSDDYSCNIVDHKFMVSGHSYLPNDRDFGSIESAKRRLSALYVPEEWCELVGKARRVNPFPVRRMYQTDFKSVGQLRSEIVNRKQNTNKEKVEWFKIHWTRKICTFLFPVSVHSEYTGSMENGQLASKPSWASLRSG